MNMHMGCCAAGNQFSTIVLNPHDRARRLPASGHIDTEADR